MEAVLSHQKLESKLATEKNISLKRTIKKLKETINERLSLIGQKMCSRCEEAKVFEEFRIRLDKRRNIVYRNANCKKCDAVIAAGYYHKRKDDPEFKAKNVERVRKYYKANIDTIKERKHTKEFREKHAKWNMDSYHRVKDVVAAKMKVKRQTPEYKEKMRAYRERNKERIYQQEVITKKRYHEKNRDTISDKYIINQLVNQGYGTKEQVIKNPDLMEFERAKILLHRLKNQLHAKAN